MQSVIRVFSMDDDQLYKMSIKDRFDSWINQKALQAMTGTTPRRTKQEQDVLLLTVGVRFRLLKKTVGGERDSITCLTYPRAGQQA